MAGKKKAKKRKASESKEEFFVALNNPSLINLSLLETRKSILESMKLFRDIKEVRRQKIEGKNKLRTQIRQISSLLGKIRSCLPHVNISSEVKEAIKEQPQQKPAAQVREEPKPKPPTELDRIEAELAEVEQKLSHLS